MRRWQLKYGLFVLVVAPLLWPLGPVQGQATTEPTRLIIELDGVNSLSSSTGRLPVRRVRPLGPQRHEGRVYQGASSTRWYSVEIIDGKTEAALAALKAADGVRDIHPAQLYRQALVPNDTQFSDQYALASLSQPLADIDAPVAWEVTTGSSDTVIAIIDGGFDSSHEDLRDKVWHNDDQPNGVDDDSNGYIDDETGWDFVASSLLTDYSSHATHVAGIAAASSSNGLGVAGVDWQAKIMNIRVLGSTGLGLEDDIVAGIYYAVDNGAHIINLSLVGSPSAAIQAAVRYAYERNVTVVAAAGNSGRDTGRVSQFPACADEAGVDMVLGVGATGEAGEPTSFSNYGTCLNVSAPGSRIVSTWPGNRYRSASGTSMSTPFVAGVAGLYRALHPAARAAEVIAQITQQRLSFTGERADEWNVHYKGQLNAALVVGATPQVGESPVSVPTPTLTPPPSPIPDFLPPPASNSEGSSESGGGGGDGGGGGGDEAPLVVVTKKPRVAGTKQAKANVKLLPRIKDTFFYVYGRLPTITEKTYWGDRVKKGHKRTYQELLGAMQWHNAVRQPR